MRRLREFFRKIYRIIPAIALFLPSAQWGISARVVRDISHSNKNQKSLSFSYAKAVLPEIQEIGKKVSSVLGIEETKLKKFIKKGYDDARAVLNNVPTREVEALEQKEREDIVAQIAKPISYQVSQKAAKLESAKDDEKKKFFLQVYRIENALKKLAGCSLQELKKGKARDEIKKILAMNDKTIIANIASENFSKLGLIIETARRKGKGSRATFIPKLDLSKMSGMGSLFGNNSDEMRKYGRRLERIQSYGESVLQKFIAADPEGMGVISSKSVQVAKILMSPYVTLTLFTAIIVSYVIKIRRAISKKKNKTKHENKETKEKAVSMETDSAGSQKGGSGKVKDGLLSAREEVVDLRKKVAAMRQALQDARRDVGVVAERG